MDLGDCYRLLGLRTGASFADIKASYRRLAHQYHPDLHPNDEKSKEKFIALTEAYKFLQPVLLSEEIAALSSTPSMFEDVSHQTSYPDSVSTTVMPHPPTLEDIEKRLKSKSYEQLQRFLQEKRFPQAIALVEALAARLPSDMEVRQWQAVCYQVWARALIVQKQLPKAQIYLKKALKTDPYNKNLLDEIQQDLESLGIKF